MSTEDIRLAPPQQPPSSSPHRHDSTASIFQPDARCFGISGGGGDPGPNTATTTTTRGFIDEGRLLQAPPELRRSVYAGEAGDDDDDDVDEEEDEEEEEDDDEDDEEEDDNDKNKATCERSDDNNGKLKLLSSPPCVDSNRGVILKACNILETVNDNSNVTSTRSDNIHQGGVNEYQNANALTVVDPNGNLYYSRYMQGMEGSGSCQKGFVIDIGCGFSGRKDGSCSSESGESLRAILSDPITGALMDDAVILPCGHSFGIGGMQHVLRMKACCTCSQPVSEESVSQNLSLRAAVQAFRREEELKVHRKSKRRRERFEPDKCSYGNSEPIDYPKRRDLEYPFQVTDRVVIVGNKRTPQRFVGREAIVTTQCLNGWYVVKTLDNAESVKLQYRSLAKVPGHKLSSKPAAGKLPSNWL